ncbi:TPA: DUF6387 family protein [Citrobacter freundii]
MNNFIHEAKVIFDVNEYDKNTSGFGLLEYYVNLNKRIEVIHYAEQIERYREMTYESYKDEVISLGYYKQDEESLLTIDSYNEYKNDEILENINKVSWYIDELKEGRCLNLESLNLCDSGWNFHPRLDLFLPIKTIDLRTIAFNQYIKKYGHSDTNKSIANLISGSVDVSDFETIRTCEFGYGWKNKSSFYKDKVWAEIDISVPDDILIESFRGWLKQARVECDIEIKGKKNALIKKAHLLKWRKLKVLPFLDLKILALYFNETLTFNQIGSILFSDEYDIDTTEKVRKTLIPFANEVMADGYLNEIAAMITVETYDVKRAG